MILLTDSKGSDQTARMYSPIWVFAVRICPKTRFRMARPIWEFLAFVKRIVDVFNSEANRPYKNCISFLSIRAQFSHVCILYRS